MANQLREAYRQQVARDRDRDRALRQKTSYGVFVWDAAGRYPETAAVRIYKREADAAKLARDHIGENWVVRPIRLTNPTKRKRNARAVVTFDEQGRADGVELTRLDAYKHLSYWPAAWPVGGLLRFYFHSDGSLRRVYSTNASGRATTWHKKLARDDIDGLTSYARYWAQTHR